MAAVEHEFFGAQTRQPRLFVQLGCPLRQFAPAVGRMNVDLDDTRVGRHHQAFDPVVTRRLVALQHHRHFQVRGGGFYGGHQFQVMFQQRHRRHEHMQTPFPGFHAQRRVRHCDMDAVDVADFLARQPGMVGHGLLEIAVTPGHFTVVIAQGRQFGEQALRLLMVTLVGRHPGQAAQRHPHAHRRVAGEQKQGVTAKTPRPALPALAEPVPFHRQGETGRFAQAGIQQLA